MQLIATQANPVPRRGETAMIRASDGVRLRVARWPARGGAARGTVTLFQGRGEFIEKYFEVVGELIERGFAVVALDWRGQGGSDRLTDNSRKGHVEDFADYQRDITAVTAQVLEPFCPRPWFALAHSMGGANLIEYAHGGGGAFERVALSAPMVGLHGLAWPRAFRVFAEVAEMTGFGRSFIPGGGETAVATRAFEGNVLTSDPQRHQRAADIVASGSFLGLGDPTIGWLDAAFRQMRRFDDPDYPRAVALPILVVGAGADAVVDTRAVSRFAARLKTGGYVEIAHARQEILMERDVFRAQFWAAFDAFIPGARDELSAAG